MADRRTVRAELEEQRLIIERQQVELLRQQHHIEMQRRRTAHLETLLDAIEVTFQRVAVPTSTRRSEPSSTATSAMRPIASTAEGLPRNRS